MKYKPHEFWRHLRNVHYNATEGRKLDWCIEVDDEEKEIIVMFEESHQPVDWFFNFFFIIIPAIIGGFPYWFSCGWWFSWCSGKTFVLNSVMSEMYKHPDYKVICSGYSFGGAIAQICGLEIYEATGVKVELITYGAPKPYFGLWSKFFARRAFTKITQYANWSDIVTWCIPLPCYHSLKNKRLGKFNIKDLFNPKYSHQIYGDEDFYK